MDGTREQHLSKVSQTQKAKTQMFSLIWGLLTQNKWNNIIEHKGEDTHGRNRERKGNLKFECGWYAHCRGGNKVILN
jgi:hypothetical protein